MDYRNLCSRVRMKMKKENYYSSETNIIQKRPDK